MNSFTIDENKKKTAPFLRVQQRFVGMRDAGWGAGGGGQNRGGMLDMRNIEGGIRDKNFLARSGHAHFNWWNAG